MSKLIEIPYVKDIAGEIEAGWNNEPNGFYGDGSLHGLESRYVGEIQSAVYQNMSEFEEWIRNNYGSEFNESCGFHIHLGISSNLGYAQLMSREFQKYFLKRMLEWSKTKNINPNHRFFHRFGFVECTHRSKDCTRYCNPKGFHAEIQSKLFDRASARYTVLNFAFSIHGTIEIRSSTPFEDIELSISQVKEFKIIINDYLKRVNKRKVKEHKMKLEQSISTIDLDELDLTIKRRILKSATEYKITNLQFARYNLKALSSRIEFCQTHLNAEYVRNSLRGTKQRGYTMMIKVREN